MFQRRREERDKKAQADQDEQARRRGRSLPVADVATRRTFLHSVVDPRLVEISKVPDLTAIRERDPDLAAALEGIYIVLDGLVADTEYLHRQAPAAECKLVTDVRLLNRKLEENLKKVDPDKKTVRIFGREIPYKQTMVIGVVVVVARLYVPTLWELAKWLLATPATWPWIGTIIGAGTLIAVAFLGWRRRRG